MAGMKRLRLMPVFFIIAGCAQQNQAPSITTPVPEPVVEKTAVRPVAASTVECAATVKDAANAVQNSITAIVSTIRQAETAAQEQQIPGWATWLSELANQAGNADKQAAVLMDRSDNMAKKAAALSETCEQLAEERDTAVKAAQESRGAAAAIKAEAAEVKADAQARLSSMADERSWWRKCALCTWAGIAVFCLAWLGIRLARAAG